MLFFDFTGDFDDVPSLKKRRRYFPTILYVLDLMRKNDFLKLHGMFVGFDPWVIACGFRALHVSLVLHNLLLFPDTASPKLFILLPLTSLCLVLSPPTPSVCKNIFPFL